jgi:glycosyltransferase involved in cell wall biosynthesis
VHWVALVESLDHVCCRYRLAAFRPLWVPYGHALELQALPRRWWSRLLLYPRLRGLNVILQRKLLSSWEITQLRRQARRMVFDFDDAVFLRDSFAAKGLDDRRRRRRFAATVAACDAVIAGNAFLAAEAERHTDPAKVVVVPTCVNPDLYPMASVKLARPTVDMVWVGSSSTLQGLQRIAPLLEEMGRTIPTLRLKVICDRFPRFQNLTVIPTPWTEAMEASELAGSDFGISWIPDDQWSRGKCGLKVLQYMAAALPVVANPVGVHSEMIRHGETGFLANTPAEWMAAVCTLAAEPKLRQRMGRAGRRRAEMHYGIRGGARAWLKVFDRLDVPQSRAG